MPIGSTVNLGSGPGTYNGVLDEEPVDEGDYEIGYGVYVGGGSSSKRKRGRNRVEHSTTVYRGGKNEKEIEEEEEDKDNVGYNKYAASVYSISRKAAGGEIPNMAEGKER